MSGPYSDTTDNFLALGRKIPHVYDLLIRGTCGINKNPTCSWSDLDFTVVVKTINFEVQNVVRQVYKAISINNPIKISITLVDLDDIISPNHHHGIKPLYYSSVIENSESLLIKNKNYLKKSFIFDNKIKFDCYSNMVYLIHDLRNHYMKCENNEKKIANFCRHLTKRSKHLARNAIFIKTGYISEDINNDLFLTHFSKVDKSFSLKLENIKNNWKVLQNDPVELLEIIEYLLENTEIIYKNITDFVKNM